MGGKSEIFLGHKIIKPSHLIRIRAVIAQLSTTKLSFWLLILPLLLLIPSLNSFPYLSADAAYSDITISHYPNTYFLKESITNWRQVPLWSSTILSGYPFAANPLAGLWYPIGWLLLIIPLSMGINLLVGLHLIWGGIGLYMLMRREGLGHIAALFAGISFAMLPKLFSHYGAGHLTLLFAIPWTPWLLLTQQAGYRFRVKGWSFAVMPGLILAIVLMADIRWGAYAAGLWWVYSLVNRKGSWRKQILGIGAQTMLALLLSAPLILPLVEYSFLSTRAGLTPSDVASYSLPFGRLFGLFFPGVNGSHEWVLYSGGFVLILALSAIILRNERYKDFFWVGAFLVSLVFSLGSQIPGYEFLTKIPFVSLLRVPSRALFLTGLSLAALSGYGLEKILDKKLGQSKKWLNLSLIALVAFTLFLSAGIYTVEGNLPAGILWGALFLTVGVLWVGIKFKPRVRFELWIVGVFLLGLVDLGVVNLNSFQGRPAEEVNTERESIAQYLSSQPGEFRTYSPSYSIPQQTAVQHGLELADGVDPLQIESYAKFMEAASGVPRTGYSVTMPPFENSDPRMDNVAYTPDAKKLGLLNVGYVVSDFELNNVDGLTLERQFDDAYVYKNSFKMPRAWVEKEAGSLNSTIRPAEIYTRNPNRMWISADGPGLLVLSEINFPGWKVWVDGEKRGIETAEGILRAVNIGEGEHEVIFSYQPESLFLGLILGIGGLLLLGLLSIRRMQLN